MLERLTVSNFAVVEKAEACFGPGLNVLTGETGAGKSVMIGALELVLGSRPDSSQVRDGADEAVATADFAIEGRTLEAVAAILGECGLPPCEDGVLVIRRTLSRRQGSRAWVNDSPATVAVLRRLGGVLADIHGPRSNQRILEESFQRSTLDSYAGSPAVRYAAAWKELCEARDRIAALNAEGDVSGEIDMLSYQIEELTAAELSEDDDEIAARHRAAANAERILRETGAIRAALDGDGGAGDVLVETKGRIDALAKYLPAAGEWSDEAEEILVRMQELSRSVAGAAASVACDPEEFEALDSRLSLLGRLKRKYLKNQDAPVADLIEALESKRARLASLQGRGEELESLAAREKALLDKVVAEGAKLASVRGRAGKKLSAAVTKELSDLGFAKARFFVEVDPAQPSKDGCDTVRFMFEPNPGESPRALAGIASSGEIARVMLALKGVLASHDAVDTLVFDEIDANIGGETGRVAGEKMWSLARFRQVMAITHLPQSAVFADRHFVVGKSVAGGRTRTTLKEVSGGDRIAEIARMLGGEEGTPSARRHAGELVKMAEGHKNTGG